jgi:hypothetical protein
VSRDLIADSDCPVVRFNDGLNNGQAKSVRIIAVVFCAPKTIEDVRNLIGIYAGSVVRDHYDDVTSFG